MLERGEMDQVIYFQIFFFLFCRGKRGRWSASAFCGA